MMDERNIKALKKKGDEIDIEISLNTFQLGAESYIMAMILDVTERNKLGWLLKSASELTLTGEGYVVFEEEGPIGIQVERLARQLIKN